MRSYPSFINIFVPSYSMRLKKEPLYPSLPSWAFADEAGGCCIHARNRKKGFYYCSRRQLWEISRYSKLDESNVQANMNGEIPTASCRTGWSSRLHETYPSFYGNSKHIPQIYEEYTCNRLSLENTRILTRWCPKFSSNTAQPFQTLGLGM